jgi:chaperonin GroEL
MRDHRSRRTSHRAVVDKPAEEEDHGHGHHGHPH